MYEVCAVLNFQVAYSLDQNWMLYDAYVHLCPVHTADDEATQLDSCVASAYWALFETTTPKNK